MTEARDFAFQTHDKLQPNYSAVCVSDVDRDDQISIRSGTSCRHVPLLTAISGELLEIAPQSREFLVALDAGKNHLGARNLRARIFDVFLECFLVPGDAGILVCIGVAEAFNRASLSTIKPVKHRSNLVGGVLADTMTGAHFLNDASPASRSWARTVPDDAAMDRAAIKSRFMCVSPVRCSKSSLCRQRSSSSSCLSVAKWPANPTKAAKPRRTEPKIAANIIFRRFM